MNQPATLDEIIQLILHHWERAGLQMSDQERRQVFNTSQATTILNTAIVSLINTHTLAFTPSTVAPAWLSIIDEAFQHLVANASSLDARRHLAGAFVDICTLLTPLVYFDAVLKMRTFDDFFLWHMELAWLTRLEIPRSVIEARRIYDHLLTVPSVYHRHTIHGTEVIPQPFMAQMCFVALIIRPTTPGSELWRFQEECLARCPAYLLDYPPIGQQGYSSRPSFWMAYTVQNPTFRVLLLRRGSDQLRRDIETVVADEQKRSAAADALVSTTPHAWQPLVTRVPTAQGALVALLDALELYLAQHVPAIHAQLRPGVADDQIEKLNALLAPLQLPEDVATLYKWHNGTAPGAELFGYPDFSTLEEALYTYREAIHVGADFAWCAVWFPIGVEHVYRLVPLAEGSTHQAVVLAHDLESPQLQVEHESIAAMVSTYLAAYQEGAIFVDEATGYWERDEARLDEIRLRHSPGAYVYPEQMQPVYDLYESHTWPDEWKKYRLGETT